MVVVVANSLTVSEKAQSARTHYNKRVVECMLASKILAKALNLTKWKEVGGDDAESGIVSYSLAYNIEASSGSLWGQTRTRCSIGSNDRVGQSAFTKHSLWD